MHPEILSTEQRELLPLLQHFSEDFYLVGGTAIALHIGHRRSIDFDLFTRKQLNRPYLKSALAKTGFPVQHILYEDTEATISQRAKSLFQNGFNPKLFRQQLCYFDDVDFSEAVDYVTDSVSNEAIQTYLIDVATSPF